MSENIRTCRECRDLYDPGYIDLSGGLCSMCRHKRSLKLEAAEERRRRYFERIAAGPREETTTP